MRENWETGVDCPCCNQLVKLYNRKLYSTPAAYLVNLYRLDRKNPKQVYWHVTEIQKVIIGGGDFSKLMYWGLITEQPKDEDDDSKRTSGYWAITDKGRDFVRGKITVPSHVRLFDGKSYGFTGKQVTIHHVLGNKFNYAELMGDAMNRHNPPENGRLL